MRCWYLVLFVAGLVSVLPSVTAAQGRSAADVVVALQEAGLPLAEILVLTEEDSLLGRTGSYVEKVSWWDSRVRRFPGQEITIDTGGTIERFANDADFRTRLAYLEAVANGPLFGDTDSAARANDSFCG
jgi:hypothetical protein